MCINTQKEIIWACFLCRYYKSKGKIDLSAAELSKETKKATNEVFMKGFIKIYDSLETNMSTPRRYIALIHNYANLFNQRTKHILLQMSRLGVSTLIHYYALLTTMMMIIK